jgi:hypothetical protein
MVTPESVPAVQRFRRSLDRAVIRGAAVRVAAIVGCWCTSAAVLWCAVVAVRQGLAADFLVAEPIATIIGIATLAGLATAAIFRDAVFRGQWPTRLAVALETERLDPGLGERLSRAVAFLDEQVGRGRESPVEASLASGLRCLAIEQAAAALPRRLAVPGDPADIKWIGAGSLAAAIALVTAFVVPATWGGANREGDAAGAAVAVPGAGATAVADGAGMPDVARAAIVRRLRAAATVERRVAAVAATLFAEAPGVTRESLPRTSQARLDRLAAIQSEVCDAVRAVRLDVRGLAASPAAVASACLQQLDAFVVAGGETIGGHVVANRLGLVSDRAAAAADALVEAAAALAADTGAANREEPIPDDPWLARAALGLDELSGPGAEAARASSRQADAVAVTDQPAALPAAPPASSSAASLGRDPGGSIDRGAAATTSPSQGSTDQIAASAIDDRPDRPAAAPAAARPTDRGWRPPAPRAPESSAASTLMHEDAPAAYRQAVAEYYRLLRPLPASPGTATEPPQR